MASPVIRGSRYYADYYLGGARRRVSLETDSLQVAKEKLRRLETALFQGSDLPLPTKTPIAQVVEAYVAHIRAVKTPKSAQTDIYYLREMFGPVAPALEITSRRTGDQVRKRPPRPGQDRHRRAPVIEARSFEEITTAQIAEFIAAQVQGKGLAPKTANRYREILCRLFNWAAEQRGVRLPGDRNPAAKVERYREHAPKIRFLTLPQIAEQFAALADAPDIRALVAVYIYAGLRREEALWLTFDDLDLKAGSYGLLRIQAKTVAGEHWEPKTKVNRCVPVSSALRGWLDRHTPRITPGRWLFPSPQGCRWDPDNLSQTLRALNRAAGLPWSCLDFRHTFGSQLAVKGESLYKIATLMGNSPEICRRHYAALVPEAMAASVEFGPASSSIPVRAATGG